MKDNFKVGEKVRLLHAKGEGYVQKVISPTRIEVLIDDFYEMELGVGEVVRIDAAESILRAEDEAEGEAPKKKGTGPAVTIAPDLPPSYVLYKNADMDYEHWVVNPGRNEVHLLLYTKVGNKFISYNSCTVPPRENYFLGKQAPSDFHMVRLLYIQLLQFPRIEHPRPIAPLTLEVNVKTDIFVKEPRRIPELSVDGWEFVLQEQPEAPIAPAESEARFVQQKPAQPPKVMDLHIEKLIGGHRHLDNNTMLRVQLEAFEKAITDAQAHHVDSMVFIHGIGNGTLKREIHRRLMGYDFVKSFELADPTLYANGATVVFF